MENTCCYESGAIVCEYAKHRNIYPKPLADVIIEYAFANKTNKSKKLGRMVEVGCGSGQITKLLAPYFDEVIASDVSINQIEYAKKSNTFEHVKYVVGAAEDIQVADKSADMVVSAASIVWFDLPKFYREVARVLKPGGCLATVGYYIPQCSTPGGDNESSAARYSEVLKKIIAKANYDPSFYDESINLYAGVFQNLPSEIKARKFLPWTIRYNLTGYKDYLRSVDLFQNKMEENISESKSEKMTEKELKKLDLVEEFGSQLKRAWKMEERSDEEVEIDATFTFAIVLARNLRV